MKTRKQAMIWAAVSGLALVLTLNGCHPISKSVSKEADRNLSFAEIRENPDQHLGKVVVLGGTVYKHGNEAGRNRVGSAAEETGRDHGTTGRRRQDRRKVSCRSSQVRWTRPSTLKGEESRWADRSKARNG